MAPLFGCNPPSKPYLELVLFPFHAPITFCTSIILIMYFIFPNRLQESWVLTFLTGFWALGPMSIVSNTYLAKHKG